MNTYRNAKRDERNSRWKIFVVYCSHLCLKVHTSWIGERNSKGSLVLQFLAPRKYQMFTATVGGCDLFFIYSGTIGG